MPQRFAGGLTHPRQMRREVGCALIHSRCVVPACLCFGHTRNACPCSKSEAWERSRSSLLRRDLELIPGETACIAADLHQRDLIALLWSRYCMRRGRREVKMQFFGFSKRGRCSTWMNGRLPITYRIRSVRLNTPIEPNSYRGRALWIFYMQHKHTAECGSHWRTRRRVNDTNKFNGHSSPFSISSFPKDSLLSSSGHTSNATGVSPCAL